MEIIFGDGYMEEWFQYGGDPHYFRAHTTNPSITAGNVREFLHTLSTVKRLSSWLEAVYVDLESNGRLTFGASSEMAGRMDVWPLVARKVETTGQAAKTGLLAYHSKLEIFPLESNPQGGLTNG